VTRRVLILAAAAVLAIAGTALAATIKYGSNLKAPANLRETHPVDSAFWAKAFPDHRGVAAPAKGKVATVKIKGTAIKQHGKKPVTLFHFQVLHPISGGKVKVSLTSGGFHIPVGGNPNQVTTYHPVNLCVKKGDFVAFSDIGGFQHGSYPNGTPFQVFSSVVGSATKHHIQSGGIGNGATFKGKTKQGEELLMRMILVTGKAAGICKS
jgi:hypothetical protein